MWLWFDQSAFERPAWYSPARKRKIAGRQHVVQYSQASSINTSLSEQKHHHPNIPHHHWTTQSSLLNFAMFMVMKIKPLSLKKIWFSVCVGAINKDSWWTLSYHSPIVELSASWTPFRDMVCILVCVHYMLQFLQARIEAGVIVWSAGHV